MNHPKHEAGNESMLAMLPVEQGAPSRNIPFDGAGVVRTVVAVPAEQVHLAWLALPSRTAVQARAAARALLANQLAVAPDTLHVAVSDTIDPAGMRLVAAVEPAVMADWLQRARALGLAPATLVPDCLLLPSPTGDEDTVQVAVIDDRWLCRGPELAFTADPALASLMLGDRPRNMLFGADADALLARGAATPPLNLLQDVFSDEPARPSSLRRLQWLVAAVVLMPLLLPVASAARHAWAANVLRETATTEAVAALGDVGDDPLAAADARLASLRDAHGLPRTLAALAAALRSRPGTHLEFVRYRPDGELVASIVHGGSADLAALDLALRESGLALAIVEEGTAPDGRQRSDLRIEAAP